MLGGRERVGPIRILPFARIEDVTEGIRLRARRAVLHHLLDEDARQVGVCLARVPLDPHEVRGRAVLRQGIRPDTLLMIGQVPEALRAFAAIDARLPADTHLVVGGGLAGLSLGTALCRAGVPVVVLEAGDYPRHRVCGEFITGLTSATIANLGLAPVLADALRHVVQDAQAVNQFFASQRLVECQAADIPAIERLCETFDAAIAARRELGAGGLVRDGLARLPALHEAGGA